MSPLSNARVRIGILAKSDRTVSDLLSYFAKVGIDAQRHDEQDAAAPTQTCESLQAMVIFPDDFEAELVDRMLAQLTSREPALFQLIVTRQPQRFTAAADLPRLVMPKPTFGWVILDAIRAHLDSFSEP